MQFKMAKQSKNWCFTLNNYSPEEEEAVQNLKDVKYLVYGREIGASLTPHLQGTIVFQVPKRLTGVSKLIPRAHLEQCRALWESIQYCKKEGNVYEKGSPPMTQQQKGDIERARWSDAVESAKKGRLEDIPPDMYARLYRTWKEIRKDHMETPEDADGVTGVWFWGESGSGKSRAARAEFPKAYFKNANKWWDGYQGQENVIIDDLDPTHACLAHYLKIWMDRYAFVAETKGGAISIRPKRIIITSQYSIGSIFPEKEAEEAINRRLVECRHFSHHAFNN